MALRRDVAEVILQHDLTDVFEKMYAPDEHYFINLLIRLNLPLENLVANRLMTFVNWQDCESETVITRTRDGNSYILKRFRPKIYQQLSETDIGTARETGCLFFRKISPTCDVSRLTRLFRAVNSI
jgi:hypothetical protein